MRIRHKVNVVIDDNSGKDKLFSPDDTSAEVNLEGYAEQSSGQTALLAGASLALPFGAIASCRGVFFRSTGDCTVALNGGAAIAVTRGQATASAKATNTKFFLESTLSSVTITAVDDCTIAYVVWGD